MFDPRDDARDRDGREDGRERVYDERDRDDDPREGLMRDLDLPRGEERELVVARDHVHELEGEDSRTLAAVGAFRVVPEHDLDVNHDTLEHLRNVGLVEAMHLGGDERGLTLTGEGRDLLDSHSMHRDDEPAQAFYAGVNREREVDHDSNLYATYQQEEARLRTSTTGSRFGGSSSSRTSSASTTSSCTSTTAGGPTVTAVRAATSTRFVNGRVNTTCRTSTGRSTSPTIASSTRSTAANSIRTSSSSRNTTAGPMPPATFRPASVSMSWARTVVRAVRPAAARDRGVPVTHEYPAHDPYNSVTEGFVNAFGSFGLTQRQREFLVTVMIHSGCFLERQYRGFTGTVRGQNSREFMARLVGRGFARATEAGAARQGRLHHVHYEPRDEAISQADNRNRRLRSSAE